MGMSPEDDAHGINTYIMVKLEQNPFSPDIRMLLLNQPIFVLSSNDPIIVQHGSSNHNIEH